MRLSAILAALASFAIGFTLPRQDVEGDNLVARDSDTDVARSGAPDSALVKRTDAYPYTDDHSVTISVGQVIYYGITAQKVTNNINQQNARITQIRVDHPDILTFTVTMISNWGTYASDWWWHPGVDETQLSDLLNDRRLISLDPYFTPAGLRFAAVMIPNTGMQARAWWWYYDLNATAVNQRLDVDKRLVSSRPYTNNGSSEVVYAVIMVKNIGVNYKA